MAVIKAVLAKIVDHSFPIFGAFEFSDISGETIVIHEKLPVVKADYVEGVSILPMDVELKCTVVSTSADGVVIDMNEPYGIKDILGRSRFNVHAGIVEG